MERLAQKGIRFLVSYAQSDEADFLARNFNTRRVTVKRHIAGAFGHRVESSEVLIINFDPRESVPMPDRLIAKSPAAVVPSGTLLRLGLDEIKPSVNNPRLLFDPDQMETLKKNIQQHGVLVPLTVYRPKGQTKYSILDGERRYRCVQQLADAGIEVALPANVVQPLDPVSGLLYMFSIHNFREQWELMPTALGLKVVMETLGTADNRELNRLTGLSDPQIERCKVLL